MDNVGPLPRSRSGKRYFLVICDYATRYPEAMPLKSIDAPQVAEELIHLFSRVGVPNEILTDQGINFTSQLLYRMLHVHPIQTTPYHPQTDLWRGLIRLTKICSEKQLQTKKKIGISYSHTYCLNTEKSHKPQLDSLPLRKKCSRTIGCNPCILDHRKAFRRKCCITCANDKGKIGKKGRYREG